MTIAIGINFGAYVLLAADTCTTYYDWNGRVLGYKDDSIKIQKTYLGLITGAGGEELLYLVKNRLKEEETRDTNQVLSIIREERRHYRRPLAVLEPHLVENTGWIFTYLKLDQGNYTLRLAMYHPRFGDDLVLFAENDPAVIFPREATEKDAMLIGDFLKESLRPFAQFESLADSFQYHWPIITKLIRAIQPKFPSISRSLQIGVHTSGHLTGISQIVKDTDETISLELTEDP
jgi:hypothetical protein